MPRDTYTRTIALPDHLDATDAVMVREVVSALAYRCACYGATEDDHGEAAEVAERLERLGGWFEERCAERTEEVRGSLPDESLRAHMDGAVFPTSRWWDALKVEVAV